MKTKDKKQSWVVVWIVSIILVITALSLLCVYLYKMYTAGRDYDDLVPVDSVVVTYDNVSSAVTSEDVSSVSESSSSSKNSSSKNESKKTASEVKGDVVNGNVNFTELWKTNTDIYAWIKIPNTNVDYPVLQSDGDDDSFYLNHNYKKQYEFAGSIYSEKINNKDFSDPMTVLYGHDMLNGTMFRTLHNFNDPNFFANNPYIYIYLPDRTLTYEIFSAYVYDDRHLLYSFDFNDEQVFADYLEYATDPDDSIMCNRRDVDVSTDDRFITLSTCIGNMETSRYLVQGVLISDEPSRKESDKAAEP